MARDYENIDDIGDLSDEELRDLVRQRLSAHDALDGDALTVAVAEGTVILGGRVGTEAQRRIAEHIVTDVVGVTNCENDIFVNAVWRAESPEAADEHAADEGRDSLRVGDREIPLSPEAEDHAESVDAALYGTSDVQRAIEDGTAWVPPDSPTAEGLEGGSAGRGEVGENH